MLSDIEYESDSPEPQWPNGDRAGNLTLMHFCILHTRPFEWNIAVDYTYQAFRILFVDHRFFADIQIRLRECGDGCRLQYIMFFSIDFGAPQGPFKK